MKVREVKKTVKNHKLGRLLSQTFLGRKLFIYTLLITMTFSSGSAFAITTISQGFTTTDKTSIGSIVGLKKNSADQVQLSTSSSSDNILGVVISSSNSLISLSSGTSNQVQVATSGLVEVLVSDINGNISQGDEITASPIAGVGMKASSNTEVVGIAEGNLQDEGATKETYTTSGGQKHTVMVGQIPVQINVAYFYKQPNKTIIPAAFQNIANALAGKSVNTVPILISMGIFLVMLIIVASMIYSMIRSSIISVGRNPMSQAAIYRDLLQMSALVLGVIAVGVVLIYVVLTRF